MSELGAPLLSTEDLRKYWNLKDVKTVREIAKRHSDILKPILIGRSLRFKPENIKKYEDRQRTYNAK